MAGINKVILVGNVGNDPDIKRANNGTTIANASIATSDRWRDKSTGETRERTEWHRVVFFGRVAEIVSEYVRKGTKIYVEGRLQTRKWVTQEGQDRYTTEVVVDVGGTMQLLDSKSSRSTEPHNESENSGANQSSGFQSTPPPSRAPDDSPPTNVGSTDDFEDDDIPF